MKRRKIITILEGLRGIVIYEKMFYSIFYMSAKVFFVYTLLIYDNFPVLTFISGNWESIV